MPYCSNCGNELGEKAKFCPSCGIQLVQKPNIKATGGSNWFQRHLNWTVMLSAIVGYGIAFGVTEVLFAIDPYTPDAVFSFATFAIVAAIVLPVGAWVLRQKGRRLWWLFVLFVPIGWIWFLLLDNHGYLTKPENEIRKRCLEYLKEEWEIGALYDKAVETLQNTGLQYSGQTVITDSQTAEEVYSMATDFSEKVANIMRRRNSMKPIPDEAAITWSSFQIAYYDLSRCASAQVAIIEADINGRSPNYYELERLFKKQNKSFKDAFSEQAKLIQKLRLSAEELQQLHSDAKKLS